MVIKMTQKDINTSDKYWSIVLIGYILGDAPYEKLMDNFITIVWNFMKKPQLHYHAYRYYIYQFASMGNRTEVLQAGPYTYRNKPIILKLWVVEFVFDKEVITTVPLQAIILGLPDTPQTRALS